jgi:hypothetical protein
MQNRTPWRLAGIFLASIGWGGCVGNVASPYPGAGGSADPGETGGSGEPPGAGGTESGETAGSGGTAGSGRTAGEGGTAGSDTGSGDCTTLQVGPERIHRLTPEEYTSSVRALVDNDELEPVLDADRERIATLDAVRKWYNAADGAVPLTAAWLSEYGDCTPEDAACAVTLYEAFAERAFRHPLTDDERAWLAESWAALPAAASLALRLETIAELILQAPQFLYLYTAGTPSGGVSVLNGHERAQRLSYFLWDSLPDAELLAAAKAGELDTSAGMRAQAERMLDDERARPVLRSFLAEWLELDGAAILPSLEDTPKSPELFADFDDTLRSSMRREVEMFMDHVMFEEEGSLAALFGSTRAYVNAPLAELYGVKGPSSADDWAWVDLNPAERAGMLTRAGFLAVHATQNVTSPIRRGVYMLTEVLCVDLPSPPANVDNTPVEATEGDAESVREATQQRTGSPSCAGCHIEINELGFAFEHYDAVGRWQDEEAETGSTIDATATLSNAGDGYDGPVDGAVELSERLAQSPEVLRCVTHKWFEKALRRSPVELDACSVQEIRAKTAEAGSLRELLLAMVESDAFLNVNHGD